MKVIGFDHTGGPEVFEEKEVATPTPAANELLIKVSAIGLNNRERAERAGEFGSIHGFTVTGRDVVGTVNAIGSGVTGFTVGETVAAHAEAGYAEDVLASPDATVKLPDGITVSTAAALITPGITAYRAVTTFSHVKAGQKVIVKGAAGGVGALAVQIATDLGAHVVGIANSRNEAFARSIGVQDFVAYDQVQPASILADRGDVVINAAMNGAGSDDDIIMAKAGGEIATVAHGTETPSKQVTINHIHPTNTPTDAVALQAILKLVQDGKLTIKVDSQLPFSAEGFRDAHAILEKSHDGRVVILTAD